MTMQPYDDDETNPSWITFLKQHKGPRERVSAFLAQRAGALLDDSESKSVGTPLQTRIANLLRRGGALVADTVARALWGGAAVSIEELKIVAQRAFTQRPVRPAYLGASDVGTPIHASVDGDGERPIALQVRTSYLDDKGGLYFHASFQNTEDAERFIGGAAVVFFGKDALLKRLCCLNVILTSPESPESFTVQGKLLPTPLGARELDPTMLDVILVPKKPPRKPRVPKEEADSSDPD
jgi:hypothetical protein